MGTLLINVGYVLETTSGGSRETACHAYALKKAADSFHLNLTNRFQALQLPYEDNSTDLDAKWEHVKQMWTNAREEVVGRKTAQHKEWTTPATLQKIRIRKDKKASPNGS